MIEAKCSSYDANFEMKSRYENENQMAQIQFSDPLELLYIQINTFSLTTKEEIASIIDCCFYFDMFDISFGEKEKKWTID